MQATATHGEPEPEPPEGLCAEERVYYRDQLREARDLALRDAECSEDIVRAVEGLGRRLHPKGRGLHDYTPALTSFASPSSPASSIVSNGDLAFDELIKMVRKARNDAIHEGAHARHFTDHAVQLALHLEAALMNPLTRVKHYMVRDPVCAQPIQPVGAIRQQMLMRAFSTLPVWMRHDGSLCWHMITATDLATFLRNGNGKGEKSRMILSAAVNSGLRIAKAQTCYLEAKVESALENLRTDAVLVISESSDAHLLGILTAFDVL